jgi:hypothetical protein
MGTISAFHSYQKSWRGLGILGLSLKSNGLCEFKMKT